MLYDSQRDGKSLHRLGQHVRFYGGPSIVALQDEGGQVFGAVHAGKWDEPRLGDFAGDSTSALFILRPRFEVLRPKGFAHNYFYWNSKKNSYLMGLGFGGTAVRNP